MPLRSPALAGRFSTTSTTWGALYPHGTDQSQTQNEATEIQCTPLEKQTKQPISLSFVLSGDMNLM